MFAKTGFCTAITRIILVFLLLSGSAVPAAAGEPLKVAYVEFPPFSYTADGKAAGTLVERFRRIAAAAGLEHVDESAPARRVFSGIPDGTFDIFLGIRTPKEFQGTTLTNAEPLGTLELRAWSTGAAPAVKAREDLAGQAVVVQTGFSYGGWRAWMEDPANRVNLVEARTPDQALALLKAGRAPLLLQYTQLMEQADAGAAAGGGGIASTVLSAPEIYIVLSKASPDAEATMARLEAAIATLKAKGALD